MVYSCAYFRTPDDSLDLAQEQKLDLICRKLRLSRGDRLLDIGCGWGGLIIHAAQNYGVDATGITLSNEQAALAREQINRAGSGGSLSRGHSGITGRITRATTTTGSRVSVWSSMSA